MSPLRRGAVAVVVPALALLAACGNPGPLEPNDAVGDAPTSTSSNGRWLAAGLMRADGRPHARKLAARCRVGTHRLRPGLGGGRSDRARRAG